MSFCQYCGEQNPDNSRFCFSCGKPLGQVEPAPMPEQVPYNEPAYQPPMPEQMNIPYNDPSFQPPKPKKNKVPIIAASAIVAILLVTAAVLIFTHTICIFHDYSEATCEQAAVCSYCEKEGAEALGHSWKDATCTAAKTCEACGVTEGEPKAHSWQEATCTIAKTCADCSKTEGTELGHNWQGGSCTTPGTCSRCGVIGTDAPGHIEGEWVAEEEATLVSGGYEEKYCKNCDMLLDSRDVPQKDPKVVNDYFNFGHAEFAEWLEDTIGLNVDYDYDYDYEDGYITYDIWTDEYDEGFVMLEFNESGDLNMIICYFDDSSLAAALAVIIATEIDPNFDKDGAVEALGTNNEEYFTDAGMTVIYTVTDGGYEYAALMPDAYFKNNI